MSFLALIVAFLVSKSLSGHGEPVTGWSLSWFRWLQQRKLEARVLVGVYALVPVLLLAGLLYWVNNSLLTFVVAVPVLLLALKSGDQPDRLLDYRAKRAAGDDAAAWQIAVNDLGLEQQLYELGDEQLDEGVQAGLAYQYLERFFVTVFWFMAFDAPGVLLVWLITTLTHAQLSDAFINRVKHALFWIPVRLMVFTLALMGNFAQCFSGWLEQVTEFEKGDRSLLIGCLNKAVGPVASDVMLEESLALIKRAQWAWLVALALVLIFG